MKLVTQEWVDKAEEDWDIAGLALRSRRTPSYNGACFHAQQCAEKYLKGHLQEESLTTPKTHDLGKPLDLLLPTHPLWAAMRPALDSLSLYAVAFRYPGDSADKQEAREALALCRGVREELRRSLGLTI